MTRRTRAVLLLIILAFDLAVAALALLRDDPATGAEMPVDCKCPANCSAYRLPTRPMEATR